MQYYVRLLLTNSIACGTIKIMKRDFWRWIRHLGHKTLLVSRIGIKSMFDKDGNYITQDDEAIEFEEFDFEEALEITTKRMSVMGYFPWEIKEAAQGMLLRRKN